MLRDYVGTCTKTYIAGDECVQSGNYPLNYVNDDSCSFRATRDIDWYFAALSTESGSDTLNVYQGSDAWGAPTGNTFSGIAPNPRMYTGSSRQYGTNGDINHGRFEWSSDFSVNEAGWRICCGTASSTASSPSPPAWSSGGSSTRTSSSSSSSSFSASDEDCDEKGKSGPAIYIMYVMSGLMAVMAVLLLGLFVTSCGGKESDPKLTGTLSKEEALKQASWGPYNMLFPRVWLKIWFGYFLMLLFTALVIPALTPSLGLSSQAACESGAPSPGPWIEAVISMGPFVQLIVMPILWAHKHRQVKAKIMGEPPAEEENIPLDPDAKTLIFARKLPCKAKFLGLVIGLIDLILRIVKRVSLGTINLSAFWFPSPFFDFYSAKLLINSLQVDGRQIAITATQADAYMKYCTEEMLNFWTLGFYGRCCKRRINYNRWLDRHLVWKGGTPAGYNDQFRIFDDKLTCPQKFKMVLLNAFGGLLSYIPILGAFWPIAQIAQWYRYKLDLYNMKFGGAQPFFVKDFTMCNYMIKYYTVGVCGICAMPVKRYVDTCIKLGEPTIDEEMAAEDAAADEANPEDAPPQQSKRVSLEPSAAPAVAAVTVEMGAVPVVGVAKKNPISLKLEELGCGQYESALADQGWDNLAALQGLTKEEAGAIADDVKMKPGHKKRFVDGIAVRQTETL